MTKRLKFFLIAFLISLPFWWGINIFQENLENYFYAQISQPFENIVKIKIPEKPQKPNPEIQAKAAISARINKREKILFRKEIDRSLPIASLTKLMTAVIVLENPENYDFKNTLITISPTAANQENAPNYNGNLKIGEKFSTEQLLNSMLIYSSNDAAQAFSEVIGTDNFVEMMNQKAEELGLNNTHFVNPTGLDPKNSTYNPDNIDYFDYSTAGDLVKLAQYILKEHLLIFEISTQKQEYKVENGILDLFLTQDIIGGKTGYTDEAGGCILFIFKDEGGNFFVNVVLGASSTLTRIEEMQKLINWLIL